MPIMSKTTALTVYRTDTIPTVDDICKAAFIPIDTTADAVSFGFVDFDDFLKPLTVSSAARGAFLACSLRIDTRRIPAPVLKKHYQQALEAEKNQMASTGKKFITKDRKREIKDQIKLKLLARAEPVPATYDVVFDLDNKLVYLCSCSKSVKERFENLWGLYFQGLLTEQTPGELAGEMMEDASAFLTGVLQGNETACNGPSGAVFFIPNKATVSSELEQTTLSIETEGQIAVNEYTEHATDAKVIKATLALESDEGSFTMTVRASDLSITGLKTPKVQYDGDDVDGAFLEKMFLIGKSVGHLHAAFRRFHGVEAVSADNF